MIDLETEIVQFDKLIQAICQDPVIHKRIIQILKMESYPRRFVLNNWLEQLRLNKAPSDLLSVLSCLFDDKIAEQILKFIQKQNYGGVS